MPIMLSNLILTKLVFWRKNMISYLQLQCNTIVKQDGKNVQPIENVQCLTSLQCFITVYHEVV